MEIGGLLVSSHCDGGCGVVPTTPQPLYNMIHYNMVLNIYM